MPLRPLARHCALLALILASTALTVGARAGSGARVIPGELLIGLAGEGRVPAERVEGRREGPHYTLRTPHSALQELSAVGEVAGYHAGLGVFRVRLRPGVSYEAAVARLRASGAFAYVEPDHVVRAAAAPDDPYYDSQQYAPQLVQADLSWEIWRPKRQVVIAVVDTGIDDTHPDLTGVMRRDGSGKVIGYNALTNTSRAADDNGHGTHCGGVAAARIDNGKGIAGIAGWNPSLPGADSFVKLMPVKVLNSQGEGSDAAVAEGVTWAADHGADVISLSLGTPDASATMNRAVQYAWAKGCVLVSAAGNDRSTAPSYPAAYAHVIPVAATDGADTLAVYSSYGNWITIAAPGSNILSSLPGGRYDYETGTSMATPHVAGEAAALMAHAPELSNEDILRLIIENTDAYTPYRGHTLAPGAGRMNVYKALLAAGGSTDPDPALASLTLSPSTVAGGGTVTGTVTLDGPAPSRGASVALSSSSSAASVPANVTVPPDGTRATFQVSTQQVSAGTPVTLSASYGGTTRTAGLTVTDAHLAGVSLTRRSVPGGVSVIGYVLLAGPAPAGGISVMLSSSDPAAVPSPRQLLVRAGANRAAFRVLTRRPTATTTATLTATAGAASLSTTLTVVRTGPRRAAGSGWRSAARVSARPRARPLCGPLAASRGSTRSQAPA